MKNSKYTLLFVIVAAAMLTQNVAAQFPRTLPRVPDPRATPSNPNPETKPETGRNGGGDRGTTHLYPNQRPTNDPILVKTSIYMEARAHDRYWKVPNESNHSSWVPVLRFAQFFDNSRKLNYVVEYSNPDGTAWFSEKLDQMSIAANRTVGYRSSDTANLLNTKSTNATGVFGFKVVDQDSGAEVFSGKFKVSKFATGSGPREKNRFDFYVDHDWLIPFGRIAFHHSDLTQGPPAPLFSFWLRGPIERKELEARLSFGDRQVASTNDRDAVGGIADYDERTTQFAPAFAPQNIIKRWEFVLGNFRYNNGARMNPERFKQVHWAEENPGNYTIRVYQKGIQIREMQFSVASDGRLVRPSYSDQIFEPYYGIVLPVKVTGEAEKWNSAAWKTDAFYGNPLKGFAAP
ncbi:MAG TPA: hypothetical protein PKD24_11395 [Pyrinomonadaceae bacterium]|nr:hypothetical protein [Pyrinomonadaceae bacterium]HMP66120.1 hypothetical protein [Pyrinomonadaceae bacterium]